MVNVGKYIYHTWILCFFLSCWDKTKFTSSSQQQRPRRKLQEERKFHDFMIVFLGWQMFNGNLLNFHKVYIYISEYTYVCMYIHCIYSSFVLCTLPLPTVVTISWIPCLRGLRVQLFLKCLIGSSCLVSQVYPSHSIVWYIHILSSAFGQLLWSMWIDIPYIECLGIETNSVWPTQPQKIEEKLQGWNLLQSCQCIKWPSPKPCPVLCPPLPEHRGPASG